WWPRIAASFPAGDPVVLAARSRRARAIGVAGDPRTASELLHELLPDQERSARNDRERAIVHVNLAMALAQIGKIDEALQRAVDSLKFQRRTLQRDDRLILTTRFNIAQWRGVKRADRDTKATVLGLKRLVATQARVLPEDDRLRLKTRLQLLWWL